MTTQRFIPRFTKLPVLLAISGMLCWNGCKNDDDDNNPTAEPITLECGTIFDDMTLSNNTDLDVDYIVPCDITLDAKLTIEPGTVIQFESDAGLLVEGSGSIAAQGSAAMPIVMEGRTAVKGAWKGIYVNTPDVANVLDHVIIRHAGGNEFNSNGDRGAIVLYASGKLRLTNSTLTQSAAYGLNSSYSSGQITFTNNTITNCDDAPVKISAKSTHKLDAASDLTGNGDAFVEVWTDVIEEEVSWKDLTVPYRVVKDFYEQVEVWDGGGLTLDAGVKVEFAAGSGFAVYDGYIATNGTLTNKVLLTGVTAAPGAWNGIYVESPELRTQLSHVEIAYAGGGAFNSNGDIGCIVVWADSYLSITDSEIRDGGGICGINAVYYNTTLVTTGTVFTNIGTDICL